MTYYEEQQEEIKTIRPRTIEINLSDADVERISEKAEGHGLTVAELIKNFIGDLVDGTYSNGSDERMYANEWFDRCYFGAVPDYTFLKYLIEDGDVERIIETIKFIEEGKQSIAEIKEDIAEMEARLNDKEYIKFYYVDEYEGYNYVKECIEDAKESLQKEQDDITSFKKVIDNYWQEYLSNKKNYGYSNCFCTADCTFEEQIDYVLGYWKRYNELLNDGEKCEISLDNDMSNEESLEEDEELEL